MVSNNSITQLHSTTPEQLTEAILKGVQTQLSEFVKGFDLPTREKYLTRIGTAKMLSISLTCLNDWSKKGILHPLKMGNRIYYKLSDIEKKLNDSNFL